MKVRLRDYKFGIYLCIISVFFIAITFAFFPYLGLIAFVLGISVLCLFSIIYQVRIRFPFGQFGYLFLLIFIGIEWYESFNIIGFPPVENPVLWELGLYILFISTYMQFIGSFLVAFKLNVKKQLIGWKPFTMLVIFFGLYILSFGILLFFTSSPDYIVRNSGIAVGGFVLSILGITGLVGIQK